MRRKPAKPGHLPRAFYEWLMHLEACERFAIGKRGSKVEYLFNNAMFLDNVQQGDQRQFENRTMVEMVGVDSFLAPIVRSSVKFVCSMDTLTGIRDKYSAEMDYILETTPLHLPYEWCTLVLTGLGKDDCVISLIETTPTANDPRAPTDLTSYPELGIEADEKFISVSMCFWRREGVEMEDGKIAPHHKLSNVPVEIHFNKGKLADDTTFLNAVASDIEVNEKGKQIMELIRVAVINWIATFRLSSVLRRKAVGIPPKIAAIKPRHKRKKFDRPMFEHFVIELEVDEPESQQLGYHADQPKKRLHQVRGFQRQLRTGKVVWVKSHWRGDPQLGVVRKDFEVTQHDDSIRR